MPIDNFEHQFENCALIAQNAQKIAQNQINSLSTSRNELMKTFVITAKLQFDTRYNFCFRNEKSYFQSPILVFHS